MIYVISFFLVISIAANIFLAIMLLRLSRMIFELEDQVEESLDSLDTCYKSINSVLSIPVASDDPMTRSVINEIKSARDLLLKIANKLVSFSLLNVKEKEENND